MASPIAPLMSGWNCDACMFSRRMKLQNSMPACAAVANTIPSSSGAGKYEWEKYTLLPGATSARHDPAQELIGVRRLQPTCGTFPFRAGGAERARDAEQVPKTVIDDRDSPQARTSTPASARARFTDPMSACP